MLATDVMLLTDVVRDLSLAASREDIDLETGLVCYAIIEEVYRDLAGARAELTQRLAAMMPEKRVTIEGAGTFERHTKANRTKWDSDALLHSVLDTRRFDPSTGELKDETPLEKVLEVWNLGSPRITAVRGRGLDPDEFCSVEYGGYTIQVIQ